MQKIIPITVTTFLRRGACAFSDSGLTEALMVRHAESEFNKYVHIPSAFL
jgi:hypothetical protein